MLKYKEFSKQQLKQELKNLKRNTHENLRSIKYVAKLLRGKLAGKQNANDTCNSVDHNNEIKNNFWAYTKKFLEAGEKLKPEFNKLICTDYFKNFLRCSNPMRRFSIPSWISRFKEPDQAFDESPPTYREISKIIHKMKASGSPCPLDQIPIIVFKKSPYLRSYLTMIISKIWTAREIPTIWKKAASILIHKSNSVNEPENFRPITLESVPLKVFTSALRNKMFHFLRTNGFIEQRIQKGFIPGISGNYEHTAHLAHLIRQAKRKQRSLVVTLLDLRNAFGEVHHRLIPVILKYHHMPESVIQLIDSLYRNFRTTIITDSYSTEFIYVEKGVLQGDCLSPLLFNLLVNTFVQYIKSEKFTQLGYSYSEYLCPKHWYQFADDAAVITGQTYENQILLNAFTAWCTWCDMKIRVDKCKTFGIAKVNSAAKQTFPKVFVNTEPIPTVDNGGNLKYLGRYFNFEMDNSAHKQELLEMVENILKKIDLLPLHPKYKLELYQFYLMSKISWHLTIADIEKTWIKENLDNLCHNRLRRWLEIPPNGTLDIVLLAKAKFGLNVIDVSTKHAQCQVSFRCQLKNSTNEDARHVYSSTRSGCNIQYDRFNNCREVLKEIRDEKLDKVNKLVSQSIVVQALWQETLVSDVKQWHRTLNKLPKNIFNFCIRYLNNTLPTLKNLFLWKKSENALCKVCFNTQTLQHVVSACKVHLEEGRYTWRHNSVLKIIADYLVSVTNNIELYCDITGYMSPSIITGEQKRPDIVVIDKQRSWVFVLELTVGFETRIKDNAVRKHNHYSGLCSELRNQYNRVKFVNISVGALGIVGKSSRSFIDFISNDLLLDNQKTNYLIAKIGACCIRSTYYIFCRKDKDWTEPNLLTW